MSSVTFSYKHDPSAGDIPAFVHYAPLDNENSTARPMVIIFHAGGFCVGSTELIPKSQISTLVRLGFVVVLPEYRLSPQVSIWDGAFADAKDCLVWTRQTLPGLLKQETGITVSPKKVVAMGQSAGGSLPLHLGSVPYPPSAILSFYPTIYLSDPAYSKPYAPFASIPDIPDSLTEQVYSGPVVFKSDSMFTKSGPDITTPRSAWMIKGMKAGTYLKEAVKDGNYDRVDPTKSFSSDFPPTCFIHGTEDDIVSHEFSVRASDELKNLGVKSELVLVQDQRHGFDMMLEEEDPLFQSYVMPGLKFLASHV